MTPTETALAAARALVAKWRDQARDQDSHAAHHLRACASDLKAALAALDAQPAPVECRNCEDRWGVLCHHTHLPHPTGLHFCADFRPAPGVADPEEPTP